MTERTTAYQMPKSPLAMGGFATTLLTLSLAMMGFRGVETQTVFIANLCFAAGIGMLISAQWEMVRGNTFGYTSLSAFGSFSKTRLQHQHWRYLCWNVRLIQLDSVVLRRIRCYPRSVTRRHGLVWRGNRRISQRTRIFCA